MRKLSLRFKKRLGVFAFVALALIAVITVLSGGTLAVGLVGLAVVAPLALTDKEQAIVDNMKTTLQAEAEKLGKGYIKTDEFTPLELQISRAFEWDRINFATLEKCKKIALKLDGGK
jgi:hypothetical protein